MNTIDFTKLTLANSPNYYLSCPKDMCREAQQTSPVFDVDIATLNKAWQKVITSQPRIEIIFQDPDNHHYQYIQKSKFLRFPDIIDVGLFTLDHKTSIALYSRAKYGYYDFNVNKKRVQQWLQALSKGVKSTKAS